MSDTLFDPGPPTITTAKERPDLSAVHWICPLLGCRNGVTVATRTPPRCPRHGAMIPDPEVPA